MAQQTSLNDNLPLNTMSSGTGANIIGNRGTATNDSNNARSKLLDGNGNKTDGTAMSIGADLIPDPMAQIPGAPPDFNVYRNKKTLTQGLMDLALFSANANQLRYVLENGNNSAALYIAASLIITSLILQVAVGLLLLMSTQYNVNIECQREKAYKFGNYVVAGIFLITIINVFIAAFGGPTTAPSAVL